MRIWQIIWSKHFLYWQFSIGRHMHEKAAINKKQIAVRFAEEMFFRLGEFFIWALYEATKLLIIAFFLYWMFL